MDALRLEVVGMRQRMLGPYRLGPCMTTCRFMSDLRSEMIVHQPKGHVCIFGLLDVLAFCTGNEEINKSGVCQNGLVTIWRRIPAHGHNWRSGDAKDGSLVA